MCVRVYEPLGQPPQERQPDFVRIGLIDPARIFKNSHGLREAFRSKLEDKFNKLDPNWLKQAHLSFRVNSSGLSDSVSVPRFERHGDGDRPGLGVAIHKEE